MTAEFLNHVQIGKSWNGVRKLSRVKCAGQRWTPGRYMSSFSEKAVSSIQ